MQSNHKTLERDNSFTLLNDSGNPLLTEVMVGLATVPLLAIVLGSRALSQTLKEVGHLSEEVFRGDRLPVLAFPAHAPDSPDQKGS